MSEIKYKKLGPFISHAIKHGLIYHTSREIRKSLHLSKPLISIWISILFMVGSFFFASAAFLSFDFLYNFQAIDINILYFIGSIFFTAAAYCQYLESINFDITHPSHIDNRHTAWFWWRWRPKNMGYISSLTQFIGTILFNISTFVAIFSNLSIEAENLFVWIPNMLGSILFLTSSFFAYLEIYHDTKIKIFRNITWWIIWINIFGSIFFQISALYSAYTVDIDPNMIFIATLTTFLGAVCFFVAALLLRYEKV